MTDAHIAAVLNAPPATEPWTAADWLRANGKKPAAERLRLWADARQGLRAALRWDRPATADACQAAADAVPTERCCRLFAALLGWIEERYPSPGLGFPLWQEPWSAERVRLVQELAAVGAVEPAVLDAANGAVDSAFEAGTSEAECSADDSGESVGRWVRAESGNAVAASAGSMQYSLTVTIGEYQGQEVEPTTAGLMAAQAVQAAGHSAAAAGWATARADATAAGLADPPNAGDSPAYQWAHRQGVPTAADAATRSAETAARSAVHSLATWAGWPALATELEANGAT